MPPPHPERSLPLLDSASDSRHHRREWKLQRIGWSLMALVVAAAATGLFGSGPLSTASTGSSTQGILKYERFVRHGSQTQLTIHAPRGNSVSALYTIRIERPYMDAFTIDSTVPQPIRIRSSATEVSFDFQADGAAVVTLWLTPMRIGKHSTRLHIGRAAPVPFTQLVYP